jgi:DNA polymerase-3 subunit epsilon
LETTGLHPGYHHRVIEIAIVVVRRDGAVEGSWSTLLNPDRDLGATDVHGITGLDVRDAPRFADVAGDVLDLLRGRVPVAHNAAFDAAFLAAEFARLDVDISDATWVCTLQLASGCGWGRRLADCCRYSGVALTDAHTVAGDAQACSALFGALLRSGHAGDVRSRPGSAGERLTGAVVP